LKLPRQIDRAATLNALAWWKAARHRAPTFTQIDFADYAPALGTFDVY
jgi:hypothetical protein